MINNKSTVTLEMTINSTSDSSPYSAFIVIPNLDYKSVVYIQGLFNKIFKKLHKIAKNTAGLK